MPRQSKMNFLSAGLPDQGPLRSVATPLRIGRKVAVCESSVWQAERHLAKGTFTYLLMAREPQA